VTRHTEAGQGELLTPEQVDEAELRSEEMTCEALGVAGEMFEPLIRTLRAAWAELEAHRNCITEEEIVTVGEVHFPVGWDGDHPWVGSWGFSGPNSLAPGTRVALLRHTEVGQVRPIDPNPATRKAGKPAEQGDAEE